MTWRQHTSPARLLEALDAHSRQPGAPPQPPVARRRGSGPRSPSRQPLQAGPATGSVGPETRWKRRRARPSIPSANLGDPVPATHPVPASERTKTLLATRAPLPGPQRAARPGGRMRTSPTGAAAPRGRWCLQSRSARPMRCNECAKNARIRSTHALRPRRASATTPRSPGDTNESRLHRRAYPQGVAPSPRGRSSLAPTSRSSRIEKRGTARRATTGKPAAHAPHRSRRMPFVVTSTCTRASPRTQTSQKMREDERASPHRDDESHDAQQPSMGFGSLRRLQKRAATCTGFPHPAVRRLQAFSAS